MTLLERQIKQTSLLNDLQHLAAMKGQIDDVPGQIHPDGAYRTQPVICRTKRHGVGLGVQALAHARCCANGCAVRLWWCKVSVT